MAKIPQSFRLDEDVIQLIEREAEKRGIKKTDVVEMCIRKVLLNQDVEEQSSFSFHEDTSAIQDVFQEFGKSVGEFRQLIEEQREFIESQRNTNAIQKKDNEIQAPTKKRVPVAEQKRGQKYEFQGELKTISEHLQPIKDIDEKEFKNARRNVSKQMRKGKTAEEAISHEFERREIPLD